MCGLCFLKVFYEALNSPQGAMDDEKLEEFVQILGRIRDLVGEDAMSGNTGIDLVDFVEQLRLSENDGDADELAELINRAEALKAQHQAGS